MVRRPAAMSHSPGAVLARFHTGPRVTRGAFCATADAESWWTGMLGPGKAFDTEKYFVVCANVLGSCYGTCGPTSINPMTGKPYSGDFPLVTVRDSVALHSRLLVEHLGVREVFAVVGGSMGGMQALEWTFVKEPPVHAAVALACNGKHNAWQIGFSGKQAHHTPKAFVWRQMYCD